MAFSEDSFILKVLTISTLATLQVESEYKTQTASSLGAYETHFLYTVGDPAATNAFSAEWESSGDDTRTPVSDFEPSAPVTGVDADTINTAVVSGLLPENHRTFGHVQS